MNMRGYQKYILLITAILPLIFISCKSRGIGGAGWDDEDEVTAARQYPTVKSNRVSVTTEDVPHQTFKQEFDGVFEDFPYFGKLVSDTSGTGISKTQITGTPYVVAYENFVLKVFRHNNIIAERKLPAVFYMHPISSAVVLGKSPAEERILCRTHSRGTTGLHYVFIADGNGDVLFEKVMTASDDWDILLGNAGEIIIGGASTKTVISSP